MHHRSEALEAKAEGTLTRHSGARVLDLDQSRGYLHVAWSANGPLAPDNCTCELGSYFSLAPHLHPRHYPARHVLWREGQPADRLVIVDRGRVKAVKLRADGRSVLLYVFGPGSVFGMLPFCDRGTYPATAIALEDTDCREISYAELWNAMKQDPDVATALLGVLGKRLREALQRVEDQSRHGSTARVAASLLLLVTREAKAPIVLDIPRPQYAFAADVGLSPESFSRALTRLEEARVLARLGRSKVQILDLDALERAAAGTDTP